MPYQKRLIVNADDFGLHPSINEAIFQSHLQGMVTSTSLMPGTQLAPAFDHALNLLPELPNLDIGLHFALVGAPGLPDDYLAFLQAKLLGDFPSSAIESMLRRQLDQLLEKNIAVSHIDSHQHLHALPSIMKVVARVANEYGITAVRLPAERGSYGGAPAKRVLTAKLLGLLCVRSKVELDRAGIKYPQNFAGMAISGALTSRRLAQLLESLEPGVTEIVCHPGSDNLSLSAEFDWGYDWQGELAAVTDKTVRAALKDREVMLSNFRSLV